MKQKFTLTMKNALGLVALFFAGIGSLTAQTTFNYTGGMQTYIVPAGITSITIEAWGAQGGHGGPISTGLGGLGGYATGILSVSPGQTLNIYVGGQGQSYMLSNATGGFNGGGGTEATSDDDKRPGCGGGASDVRVGGTALTDRVIVAGGGGGASGWMNSNGGMGGGLTGQDGQPPLWQPTWYGGGGTQVSGGVAGGSAQAGALGLGGRGKGNSHGGGGGGGGYYGGGGGNVDAGGGGSSYLGGVAGGTTTAGVQSGNGMIVITVNCSPTMITPDQGSLSDVVALCEVTDLTIPTATNDCGATVNGTHNASLPITAVGTTVVTWTYDDGAGNITTQNQNVIISGLAMNVTQAGASLTVDEAGASYQWIDCNNGNAAIAGEVSQNFVATVDGSYAVVVTNSGCVDTSACYIVDFSGVNEFDGYVLNVYPNPATDGTFTVDYKGEIKAIVVFDMLGRSLDIPVDYATGKVNVSSLSNGSYTVKVITGTQSLIKEIVVKN